MRSDSRHRGEAGGGWRGFPPLLATDGRNHKGDCDMRTGAIFARGSCRALKWMALAGMVFALGAGTALAQVTIKVAADGTATATVGDVTVSEASARVAVGVTVEVAANAPAQPQYAIELSLRAPAATGYARIWWVKLVPAMRTSTGILEPEAREPRRSRPPLELSHGEPGLLRRGLLMKSSWGHTRMTMRKTNTTTWALTSDQPGQSAGLPLGALRSSR